MTRVLIAGVGYRNLRDHSFGIAFVDTLAAEAWPAGVDVEDLSYNPIAVVQRLQDVTLGEPHELAIFAGALPREGRAPGSLAIYRWDRRLPAPDRIHEAITEAVTGIIALDNTLIIAGHFEALPQTVVVVEIEPVAHECGATMTPEVTAALARACHATATLARDPGAAHRLAEGGLALERPHHSGVVFAEFPHADASRH